MAGTGPTPKPDDSRRRRNAPTHGPERAIVPDEVVRGPEPSPTWSDPVVEWFETWRRAPQAQLFEATDWQRLKMLAPVVERALLTGSSEAMKEVRMTESLLGATVADRLRTRIRIDRDTEAAPHLASVTDARERIADRLRKPTP